MFWLNSSTLRHLWMGSLPFGVYFPKGGTYDQATLSHGGGTKVEGLQPGDDQSLRRSCTQLRAVPWPLAGAIGSRGGAFVSAPHDRRQKALTVNGCPGDVRYPVSLQPCSPSALRHQ